MTVNVLSNLHFTRNCVYTMAIVSRRRRWWIWRNKLNYGGDVRPRLTTSNSMLRLLSSHDPLHESAGMMLLNGKARLLGSHLSILTSNLTWIFVIGNRRTIIFTYEMLRLASKHPLWVRSVTHALWQAHAMCIFNLCHIQSTLSDAFILRWHH